MSHCLLAAHSHVRNKYTVSVNRFDATQGRELTSQAAFGSNQVLLLQEQSNASTSMRSITTDAPNALIHRNQLEQSIEPASSR
jgi:hypothetical protein